MAQVDKNTFNSQFNNSGGGYFPTNNTQAIASVNMRTQALTIKDSVFFLIDDAYSGAKGLAPGINTIAGLKAIGTAALSAIGLYVLFRDSAASNVLRVYELVTGTDAESSPNVIRPGDYAASTNEKVWKIATVGANDAASITNTPAGDISATNVQAAINEIDTEKQAVAKPWTWATSTGGNTPPVSPKKYQCWITTDDLSSPFIPSPAMLIAKVTNATAFSDYMMVQLVQL